MSDNIIAAPTSTDYNFKCTPRDAKDLILHIATKLQNRSAEPFEDAPTAALEDFGWKRDLEQLEELAEQAQSQEAPYEAFLDSLPNEFVEAAYSTEADRWLPELPAATDRAFDIAYGIMSTCKPPIEPFENQYGTPHIKIGHDVMMLDSERAERRIRALTTQHGYAASSASTNFQEALSAFAMPDIKGGPQRRTVYKRTALVDGTLYLNLAQEGNRNVVAIDEHGYQIIECPDNILFMKFDGAQVSLPTPLPGGTVGSLKEFWRCEDPNNIKLLLSAAASYLIPDGPYAILSFVGTMGSGKTTAARQLRSLVDPRDGGGMLSLPEKQDDLFETAAALWLLAYDNLDKIPSTMSNNFCQIREGAAEARRKMYAQGRIRMTHTLNPIIMTSVNPVTTKSDLEDRTITVTFRSRTDESTKTDATIRSKWEEVRPQVFGLICDALSKHLARKGKIEMKRRPRNAEFAQATIEMAPAFEWTEAEAENQIFGNTRQAHLKILENSIVYEPLKNFLELQKNGEWEGEMQQLVHDIQIGVHEDEPLVKWLRQNRTDEGSPERLSKEIRNIVPSWLMIEDFIYEERHTAWKRTKFMKLPSQPSQPSQAKDGADGPDGKNGELS